MRTPIRVAVLSAATCLLAGTGALAAVPNAFTSSIGKTLLLSGVGADPSVADPGCEKLITVRDAANHPIRGSLVIIEFANCMGAGEVRIGNPQPFPGMFLNCSAGIVSALTNEAGIAVFRIVGASNLVTGNEPGVGEGCAKVTADGIPLGFLSVGTPDLNGANGTPSGPGIDALDTALFAIARHRAYRSTANFIGPPGIIDGQDTVVLASFRFGSESLSNGPFCP